MPARRGLNRTVATGFTFNQPPRERSNTRIGKRFTSRLACAAGLASALVLAGPASAQVVKITMAAMAHEIAIDNKGTKYPAWTFGEHMPGPVVRVKQGDIVEFTLVNPKTNKNSHSMDFHAAVVDVLDEFAPVKPGESKTFRFEAKYPGVFVFAAPTCTPHRACGMFGIVIVDPKEGFTGIPQARS